MTYQLFFPYLFDSSQGTRICNIYMFNRPLKFLWSPCRATIHDCLSPNSLGTPDFDALATHLPLVAIFGDKAISYHISTVYGW
jgi:hypothetical protein